MKENFIAENTKAFFITFVTYGTRLQGDVRRSVHKKYNQYGTPTIPPNKNLNTYQQKLCKFSQMILNKHQRTITLNAIIETCHHSNWLLYAAHVRTNHVHLLCKSDKSAEKTLAKIKAYSTRALNRHYNTRPYWAKHGSTRYLFLESSIINVANYIVNEQGSQFACYCNSNLSNKLRDNGYC